jgi:hypothetical protein
MTQIKPKYEIHKLHGTANRRIANPLETGGFDYEDKEVDAGYMVYFPNGSSIRCWDEKHLASYDFHLDKAVALVDMDTGDEMGQVGTGSLKQNAERKASRTRDALPGLGATEGVK